MKKILTMVFLLAAVSLSAQTSKYQLSAGIIDSATGKSTAGIRTTLKKYDEATQSWNFVSEVITGSSERFLERKEGQDNRGIYKITYYTHDYFKKQGIESIFPFIEVNVNITTDEDYSFPIVVTPFGYSAYRGNGYTTPKKNNN